MTEKKIIYISNINLDGPFLPGVIHKIYGQEKAFRNYGIEVDLLYPNNNGEVVLKRNNGDKLSFKGARKAYTEGTILYKILHHYKSSWYGSINFAASFETIVASKYDAIYLRFYLPGKDLVCFLKMIRKRNPGIKILLEYPTLNTRDLFKNSLVRRVSYSLNHKRIEELNKLSDYLITLTKDKTLFGKPAIFMANGIDLGAIKPVETPVFQNEIVLFGVASDCAFYHGFDKIIKGLARYNKEKSAIKVRVRIISNPLSRNVDDLKVMAKELKVGHLVSFERTRPRVELAEEYKKVHLGLGTLALHRIGLMDNYSLKHREYAAFGLPFIMSKGDDYFENSDFVYTVERDEEPVDIKSLVDFYLSLRGQRPAYTVDFRKSIENKISWEAQLKNVFEVIWK